MANKCLETIKFGRHVGGPFAKRKNCFLTTFTQNNLTKNLFSWTFPTQLVAMMSATLVNRETGPWFEELSWHLKVPWKLIINVKRIPIHRLAVQIEGGTAAVGFLLSKKLAKDSISVWIEVSNCRVDILVARNALETIKFGCHVGALWQEKKLLFDTITRRIFSQKTMSCFRGHSLRDWLPWCHATSVNRETRPWFEELSWHLKVPWKLINAKRIPRHRLPIQI